MNKVKNKGVTALALMFVVMLLMAGCQKQPKEETTATDKKQETTEETKKKEEVEEVVPYEAGVLSEAGFESKWMKLKFVLPENCAMGTEEEMKQIMDAGAAQIQAEQGKEIALEEAGVAYEMLALNALDNANVNVLTEKLALSAISEETYLEAMKSTGLGEGYQISEEITEETIGGQIFKKVSATVNVQGMQLNQEICIKKMDGYMVVITFSFSEGAVESRNALVNAFQPY